MPDLLFTPFGAFRDCPACGIGSAPHEWNPGCPECGYVPGDDDPDNLKTPATLTTVEQLRRELVTRPTPYGGELRYCPVCGYTHLPRHRDKE